MFNLKHFQTIEKIDGRKPVLSFLTTLLITFSYIIINNHKENSFREGCVAANIPNLDAGSNWLL